jgi:hypothetical protein
MPCSAPGSYGSELITGVRQIVPEDEPQTIIVIAFNDVHHVDLPDRLKKQGVTAELVSDLIPFLGYLLGMAHLGHSVVVFEGHSSALVVACRDADLLIVDEVMLAHLQQDWISVACGVMRKPRILVLARHGRIVPVDPMSGQRPAIPDEKTLQVDLGRFDRVVRANGARPLPLILIDPASYLSERLANPPRPKRAWWWPFGRGS